MEGIIFKLWKLGITLGIALGFFIIGKIFNKALEKFTVKNSLTRIRSNRIKRFMDTFFLILFIITETLILGFNVRDFFVGMAAAFTIIGTAFFASWSNLSNISSGIIIFFSYKLKIGDRVKLVYNEDRVEGEIQEMKMFYIEILTDEGDLVNYPNNLLLHNVVRIVNRNSGENEI